MLVTTHANDIAAFREGPSILASVPLSLYVLYEAESDIDDVEPTFEFMITKL